jgi:hypothetical protein
MLVCATCARVVVFRPDGWAHRDDSNECYALVVAWPPPAEDDDAAHDAA